MFWPLCSFLSQRNLACMGRAWVSGLLWLWAGSAWAGVPHAPEVQAANRFTWALYHQLSKSQAGDFGASPLSVHLAARQVLLGAKGDTAKELRSVLGVGPDAEATLQPDLGATGNVLLANRLFLAASFKPKPDFLSACDARFGTKPEAIDMEHAGERINAWVKAQTQGHLEGVVPPGPVDAQAVLVNTLHFEGQWLHPFKFEDTSPGPFWGRQRQVSLAMMSGVFTSPFVSGAGFQVVELPYVGEAFSLVLVVPDAEQGLTELEKKLTPEWLDAQLSKASPREYVLRLPKLSLESSLELSSALQALGVTQAFLPSADFSGIAEERPLFLSRVFHRAYLVVDEDGTVASAASAALITKGLHVFLTLPPAVDADHPFLFALRHRPSGALLFVGCVVQPPGAVVASPRKFVPVDPKHGPRSISHVPY